MRNNRKGQNVMEYILLVAAVLGVFIVFLSPTGKYKKTLENSLFNGTIKQLESVKNEIKF